MDAAHSSCRKMTNSNIKFHFPQENLFSCKNSSPSSCKGARKVIAEKNAVLQKKTEQNLFGFLHETGFKDHEQEGAWLTKERTVCTQKHPVSKYTMLKITST